MENVTISNNTHNQILNYNGLRFNNVSIYGTASTGLMLNTSTIYIDEGFMVIFNNTGTEGGGIALYGESQIVMKSPSKFRIYNNKASYRGGGIFKQLPVFNTNNDVYIDYPFISLTEESAVYIGDNSANIGDDIFGFNAYFSSPFTGNEVIINEDVKQNTYPNSFCFCNGNGYQSPCITQLSQRNIYPGQTVEIFVALFGYNYEQEHIITDGTIQISITGELPITIKIDANCTKLSLQLHQHFQTNGSVLISSIYNTALFGITPKTLSMPFIFLSCPIGFALSSDGICNCDQIIKDKNSTCDIETHQISRVGTHWIGTYNNNNNANDSLINSSINDECLIAEPCLMCNQFNVTFILNDDEYFQCNNNRSGILCGQCRDNYSLLLGSNRCELCNNNYNLALIILFAALGIILIVFLLLFNLTVSQGTLNGIIFYANIVKLYQPYLSKEGAYPFFNQVLSWFNLDFGIETCFFDGMDNYSKTWLQYAFPLYLWSIVGILMLVSKRSNRVAKLNLIPILATLLLLSYTNILHSIVDGLHLHQVNLHCESESLLVISVWYIDPNLRYAQGKHVWLFGFSLLMLVFFCIPYTLFLLFSPVLEKYCQNYKCCHSLYKFKPIFDAYNGRVKDNYRFWTGLLLVARLPPLLSVALLDPLFGQSRLLMLYILLTVVSFLLLQNIWLKGVYDSNFLSILESWFLLKLIVMVVLAIFIDNGSVVMTIMLTITIAIFICSFIVILCYHIHLILIKKTWYKVSIEKMSHYFSKKKQARSRIKVAAVKKNQQFTHSSLQIERQNSALDLLDSPTDDSYYEALTVEDDLLSQDAAV